MSGQAEARTSLCGPGCHKKIRERQLGHERTTTIFRPGNKAVEHNQWTEDSSTEYEVYDAHPEVRYVYQYDSDGNWTQQAEIESNRPELPPIVRHRTLTYS